MKEPSFIYKTIDKKDVFKGLNISLPLFIAGPCAVESFSQLDKTAECLKALGINYMRAGAYKPRTSPYSFTGLKEEGLYLLKAVKEKHGIKIVTELTDIKHLDKVSRVGDVIQIGSRNCQNFELLTEIGKCPLPVLLKRGMMSKVEEFLLASEYVLKGGNKNLILCERGIRTFDNTLRNTLDVGAISYIKANTNLPVIADPSHASGFREYVFDLGLSAIAAGADGLIVEVHPDCDSAKCDGRQSLTPDDFKRLYYKAIEIYKTINEKPAELAYA
jgi:3-deoxy-7-phosphoheptulonate synthase